jgi:hypothetical protein
MGSIVSAPATSVDTIWGLVSDQVRASNSLEAAAQALLHAIYTDFEEALALVRLFVTVPYGDLPGSNRAWVSNLAEEKGVADELTDRTAVLSLVGTRGEEAAWNDIRRSEGHVGIPLVSPKFVDAIPMVARLLSDLGITDVADTSEGLTIERGGSSVETFYVRDAMTTVDDRNRNVIPMQDFVAAHEIRTVFGAGGSYGYGTNSILVCIFFSKEDIPKETARMFESLVERFRDATRELRMSNQIFA